MAQLLNKPPDVYEAEKRRFLKDLKQFHTHRGSPFKTTPAVDGVEIDLYLLYWLVTVQGGWEKVNAKNDWEELLENFGIPESTANGAILLKQTYLRYLDPYEKIYFLGEDDDDGAGGDWDEEDTRSRRQKAQKIQSSVPLSYNYKQHQIPDEHREACGLSTDVYRKTDYDRLALSLSSPMPNEQDFGINVATLLSNEGKHNLKLVRCPRLVNLLLGHAGIFNHHNLEEYLNGGYIEARGYDVLDFWGKVCKDWSIRDLMLHPYDPVTGRSCRKSVLNRKKKRSSLSTSSAGDPSKPSTSSSFANTGAKRLQALKERALEEMEAKPDEDALDEIFARGPSIGARELAGQRVLQVASILRNLSFEEDNAAVLSKNMTCLRFCLLCTGSQWSNLNQMGFDILSNIASDISLDQGYDETCVTDCLLSTLTQYIDSTDRFQVVSSLDVLTKLCLYEANESFISEVVTDSSSPIYNVLVKYLSIHDIPLLISTLECLYALSCLGEATCNSIARTHGALDALVSLVTVEAQSYGPKACILMKVVETVPVQSMAAAAASTQQSSSISAPTPLVAPPPAAPTVVTPIVPAAVVPVAAAPSPTPQPPTLPAAAAVVATNITPNSSTAPPQPQQQQLIQTAAAANPVNSLVVQPNSAIQARSASPSLPDGSHTVRVAGGQIVQVQRPQTPTTVQIQQQNTPVQQAPQPLIQPAQQQPQQPRVVSQPVSLQPQPNNTVPLQQQQQPKPLPFGQIVQTQPNQQQPIMVQQVQQQPVQQQSGSQQVQLRVSNDEANRQFCLSWLKATYEPSPGACIDQNVMYKQYLASLHKLGKRDVISGQHYVAAVRTLFGVAVGPLRKQLATGQVQNVFEGVKVRSQPLPLKIPSNQPQPVVPLQQAATPALQQVTMPQPQQPHFVQVQGGPGAPGAGGIVHIAGANGTTTQSRVVVSQPATQVIQGTTVYKAAPPGANNIVTSSTTTGPTPPTTPTPPATVVQQQTSPILTNLLHRGGGGGPGDEPGKPKLEEPLLNNTSNQQHSLTITNQTKGETVKLEANEVVHSTNGGPIPNGNGLLANLLENNKGHHGLVNGVSGSGTEDAKVIVNGNGSGGDIFQGAGIKRPAPMDIDSSSDSSPVTKKMALESGNGVAAICNGVSTTTVAAGAGGPGSAGGLITVEQNGGDGTVAIQPVAAIPTIIPQKQIVQTATGQHIIVQKPQLQQQIITLADGKKVMVKTPVTSTSTPSDTSLTVTRTPSAPTTLVTSNGVATLPNGPTANGQPATVVLNGTTTNGQPENGLNGSPQVTSLVGRHPSGGGGNNSTPTLVTAVNSPNVIHSSTSPSSIATTSSLPGASSTSSVPSSLPQHQQLPLLQTVPGSSTAAAAAGSPSSLTQPQLPAAAAAATSTSLPVSVVHNATPPPFNPQKPFLCEWEGCYREFRSTKETLNHAILTHCPEGMEEGPCRWARCDGMIRKRFSLMQHIMDRHCHNQVMLLVAKRRMQLSSTGRSDLPLPPAPPPHPGYAPNAALHAIKRHAQEFVAPKARALTDESEGPVTKGIRLTSSLILKNLVTYSNFGKRRLRPHEAHLSTVALSNVESSRTIGQILHDMNDMKDLK